MAADSGRADSFLLADHLPVAFEFLLIAAVGLIVALVIGRILYRDLRPSA